MKLEKFKSMEIGKILDHIIDKTPYVVSDQTTIQDASKKMVDNKYNMIAVTDKDTKVNQVVTSSDITYILSNQIKLDPNDTLDDIKTRINYNPIHTKDTIKKLLDIIIQGKINSIVIVDKDEKYYGIINKNKLKEAIDDIVD